MPTCRPTPWIRIAVIVTGGLLCANLVFAADPNNGKRVFDVYCWGCHQPLPKGDNIVYGRLGGPGAVGGPRYVEPPNGTFTLLQRYHGKVPEALEDRTNLTVEFIKRSVRAGVATPKKADQLGTVMPPIRKSEVSDQELDDIAAYLMRSR